MPVITRNQSKSFQQKSKNVSFQQGPRNTSQVKSNLADEITMSYYAYETMKCDFVHEIKALLNLCDSTIERNNKIIACTKIYKIINDKLPKLVKDGSIETWIKFVATIFNKSTEFIHTFRDGDIHFNRTNKEIVKMLLDEIYKTRNFATELIKNYDTRSSLTHRYIIKAKNDITKLETQRPKRVIFASI
jgi:hypothetical protein